MTDCTPESPCGRANAKTWDWATECRRCHVRMRGPVVPPRAAARPAAKAPRRVYALPVCPLRGSPTGETRACPTCTGTVAVPLLACSTHGVCTDSKLVTGVKCCRICTDRP